MKISKVLHVISVLVGFFGVFMLIGAWRADFSGSFLGMTQDHLFKDATVLILVAIWLQIATIHHMMLEKKQELV